jgi:hypothetical protein
MQDIQEAVEVVIGEGKMTLWISTAILENT